MPIDTVSLRVAVATDDDRSINLHFGQTEVWSIYEVNEAGARLIEKRPVAENTREGENARDVACRILADCPLMLAAKVGVSPKAILAAAGFEVVIDFAEKPIDEALAASWARTRVDA